MSSLRARGGKQLRMCFLIFPHPFGGCSTMVSLEVSTIKLFYHVWPCTAAVCFKINAKSLNSYSFIYPPLHSLGDLQILFPLPRITHLDQPSSSNSTFILSLTHLSLFHSPGGEGQRSSAEVWAGAVYWPGPAGTSSPSAHGCVDGWALIAVDTQMAALSTAWHYLSKPIINHYSTLLLWKNDHHSHKLCKNNIVIVSKVHTHTHTHKMMNWTSSRVQKIWTVVKMWM